MLKNLICLLPAITAVHSCCGQTFTICESTNPQPPVISLKEAEPSQSAQALVTAVEYALLDFALQKARSEKKPVEKCSAMVDDLLEFIRSHSGKGLFLEARLDRNKLLSAYGFRSAGK